MKKIFWLLLLLPFCSCKKNPGTLSGNVFWKYNDYVGNKPDAGATIYLFSSDTSKDPLRSEADVQGNYKIDPLLPGKYMMIVESKNATSSPLEQYMEFQDNNTEGYLGFYLPQIIGPLSDTIISISSKIEMLSIPNPDLDKRISDLRLESKMEGYVNKLCDSVMALIPKQSPLRKIPIIFGMATHKIKI